MHKQQNIDNKSTHFLTQFENHITDIMLFDKRKSYLYNDIKC